MGTLEQIMVSPIRPAEFILGKTVPFFLVGLGITGLVISVGLLWFRIPFIGNPLVLLLGTTLYLLSTLALGLLISTLCSTQQQAFATNFFVLNPFFILSGFELSDRQHAGSFAVVYLLKSPPVLSHRCSRDFSKRHRVGDIVAGSFGNGGDRGSPFNCQHSKIPKIA